MTPLKPLALSLALLLGAGAVQADEPLLLVHRDALLHSPPTQAQQGQSEWDMHRTGQSRTSIVRLEAESSLQRYAEGERTLIVLDGQVRFSFGNEQKTLGPGDYVAIPAGQAYRIQAGDGGKPLLLGFDVPGPAVAGAQPVIKQQAQVMAGPTNWNDPSDRGWTLDKTAAKRVNLVEMFSELKNHSHPDADHSLILLKGRARVVTPTEEHVLEPGDYVSIPRNVPHKYYVDGDQPALFVSFDAPAYDPAKTLYLE